MFLAVAFFFLVTVSTGATDALEVLRKLDLEAAPHHYYSRETNDRFARLRQDLEAGRVKLDRSNEKSFLLTLLKALQIPESSQMLVFSTTSLQLSLISPSNPRALYFNEDTYLGFVPGGRVEIISMDPEVGGVFYIFDVPRRDSALAIERSRRCMNCHSGSESGYVPGLMIKSVIPGRRGGSLEAFRVDKLGHAIPLEERFGGWYLTGKHGLTNHWANAIGLPRPGGVMDKEILVPGERFSFSRYAAANSDILPQLVHEHQAGFVMRALQAGYVARALLHQNGGSATGELRERLMPHVRELVRYILFADEARLPLTGIEGDAKFKQDFLRNRRTDRTGASLKDFELRSRLFRYRCSYMVYSPMLQALPQIVKSAVFSGVKEALSGGAEGAHIPSEERAVIRSILEATHEMFPEGPQ